MHGAHAPRWQHGIAQTVDRTALARQYGRRELTTSMRRAAQAGDTAAVRVRLSSHAVQPVLGSTVADVMHRAAGRSGCTVAVKLSPARTKQAARAVWLRFGFVPSRAVQPVLGSTVADVMHCACGRPGCTVTVKRSPACRVQPMRAVWSQRGFVPSRAVQPVLGSAVADVTHCAAGRPGCTVAVKQSPARTVRLTRAVWSQCGFILSRAVQPMLGSALADVTHRATGRPGYTDAVKRSPERTVQLWCGVDNRLEPYSPRWAARLLTSWTVQPADPAAWSWCRP